MFGEDTTNPQEEECPSIWAAILFSFLSALVIHILLVHGTAIWNRLKSVVSRRNKKDEIERAKYGKNQASVRDALDEQTHKQTTIRNYQSRIQDVLNKTQDENEKARLQAAYDSLVDISEKKINCLNTMQEITSLEDACANLAIHFDSSTVAMVSHGQQVAQKGDDQNTGFVSPSSQDCVFAARDNWTWISKLVRCISTHLENASTYQQFFHEVDESEQWMEEDLKKLNDKFHTSRQIKGDYDNAKRLLEELQELVISLRQWETKTSFMWEQAVKVVPVHLRTKGVSEPTPMRCLVDYETQCINAREGEDLLLLANSDPKVWTVRNNRGQEAPLPALVCLIPGPYKDAVDAGVRMRLKLLAAWTTALKRVGKKLITFMLLVFKAQYNDDEIAIMRSITLMDKRDLQRILDYVEDTLKVHWADDKGFQLLQERVLSVRMIMNEGGTHAMEDENASKALVVQVQMLETLMDKYKELWREWELFKCGVETSQHPELMLIVDKWQQLQFVGKEDFTKFWQMELTTSDSPDGVKGEAISALYAGQVSAAPGSGMMEVGRGDRSGFDSPDSMGGGGRRGHRGSMTPRGSIGGPRGSISMPEGQSYVGPDGQKVTVTADGRVAFMGPDGQVMYGAPDGNGNYIGPDGKVVTVSADGKVDFVGEDGKIVKGTPTAKESFVGPDGEVVSVMDDGRVGFIDKDGQMVYGRTDGKGNVIGPGGQVVSVTPDGKVKFVGSDGKVVKGSPTTKGSYVGPNGETAYVTDDGKIGFLTPDGKTVYAKPDGQGNYIGPDGQVVTIGPDGTIAFVGKDGMVIEGNPTAEGTFVSPDGQIVSLTSDGKVGFIGPDGEMIYSSPDGNGNFIGPNGEVVRITPDGKLAFVGKDGKLTKGTPTQDGSYIAPNGDVVTVTPDGKVSFVGADGKVVYGTPDGNGNYIGPGGQVVTITPDGQIAFVGRDGKVTEGTHIDTGNFIGPDGQVAHVTPDGKVAFVGKDGEVMYGTPDGKGNFIGPDGQIVSITQDGKVAFIGSDGRKKEGAPVESGSYVAPNGQTVQVTADGKVGFVGADGQMVYGKPDGKGNYIGPDGQVVAIAPDGKVKFVGKNGRMVEGTQIEKGSFIDPNGQMVTVTEDGKVAIIGADGETTYARPDGEGNFIGPDGQVITVSADGKIGFVGSDGKVKSATSVESGSFVGADGQVVQVTKDGKVGFIGPNGQIVYGNPDGNGNYIGPDGQIVTITKDGKIAFVGKDGKAMEGKSLGKGTFTGPGGQVVCLTDDGRIGFIGPDGKMVYGKPDGKGNYIGPDGTVVSVSADGKVTFIDREGRQVSGTALTDENMSNQAGFVGVDLQATVGGGGGMDGQFAVNGGGDQHGGRGSRHGSMVAVQEQMIEAEDVSMVSAGLDDSFGFSLSPGLAREGSDFGMATTTRIAETEQLDKAYGGERKTFSIRSVIDPRDDNEISLQDAILAGIINPDEGNYVNPDTKEKTPIPIAMQEGRINVAFTTTKREKEQKTSVGIITIKTVKQQPSQYDFKSVVDTKANESVSHEEALKRNIIDDQLGVYRDLKNRQEMLISEAIEKGFVEAQMGGDEHEPEVTVGYYAVRAVVDRRRKKIVTFQDAVNRGLIDKDRGCYKDTVTGEEMYIGDAIMKGFLKARRMEERETHSLDVNPENKMVVDKTDALKKKLLRPLGVIMSLKRAARVRSESESSDA